ncbi:HesA/MoeB/ThiF family protein [Pseudemcibacter aquimaris]|uniref:HesA/MoeB/ThiF family protein n=1 Tax=Pseudemcibacter aquimaris TaxID=2857064 RepID=UPI002012949C|nr:molybdopterin-synthase adenylyltransferase MoeB [Pseudemcibacter aquimaris]MCC3861891.1 molybdopterin-synthase adenylyltransferase MoeB [Pseudemcibacter aquimaris]WDU58644.1 molybdopterin-synthase adenylyltransferase MoeB [Pseudemcibacter aquimaris]
MKLTDEQLERYARHIILKEVGGPGQQALMNAKVLVIGAGGLGSPLLMYLAAAGIGTIGIIDDDTVDLSNLQRQIIHKTDALDTSKVESAANSIHEINPDIQVNVYAERLTDDNAEKIISEYDLVADGCDNFTTRFLVNDTCLKLEKPLISGALSQFDGQLATFKGYEHDKPCYRCLVPDHPQGVLSCAEAGILGAVAGVVGTMQAVEVLKEILEIGDGLAGKLLIYDALSATSRTIKLPKDPGCKYCN